MRNRVITLAILSLAAAAAAQDNDYDNYTPHVLFAVVKDGQVVAIEDDWQGRHRALEYTKTHGGSYVVFFREQQVYRLTDPAQTAQLQTMAAPLIALGKEQERLAALQVPLSERQQQLSKQMATAVGPEGVGRVGQEQGKVGQEQGRIGQEQGRIGHQQGDVFRSVRDAIRKESATCLAAHRCLAVPFAGATEKGPA